MYFVAAVGKIKSMRTLLGLFEGVCTRVADGYARMAGKPAATLLHLGPGLGNGFANLHNARRANSSAGNITPEKVWSALVAFMPENAIISDESITSGSETEQWTIGAPHHDWLNVTGGAIGQEGMLVAVGAAIACPDRKVFSMQSDGAGMYTLQALWTQAREKLDIVTVIFANRAYKILQGELKNLCTEAHG
jgi:acetolactate synthase-1/2/3 large subunit